MEQNKKFLSSPKNTAILGLVGAIISLLYYIIDVTSDKYFYFEFTTIISFIATNIATIGLTIYFTIVLMRIYNKNGNIRMANILLIVSFVLQTAGTLIYIMGVGVSFLAYSGYGGLLLNGLISLVFYICCVLYFCNILLGNKNSITNKTLVIVAIIFLIDVLYLGFSNISIYYGKDISIISIILDFKNSMPVVENIGEALGYIIYYTGYFFMIPYFYNYYNLLKEGQKNGK